MPYWEAFRALWLWLGSFGEARVGVWLCTSLAWLCQRLKLLISVRFLSPMNTGVKNKRKAGALHVHQVGTSNIAKPSLDLRRTRLRTHDVGETSNAPTAASEASEDLRTLQAVDDIQSFSYLLGEQFPIFPDDNDYPATTDNTIRVTLKDKRNDNSVRSVPCIVRCVGLTMKHRTFP